MSIELRAPGPRFYDEISSVTAPAVFEEAYGQYLPPDHPLRALGQSITAYYLKHGAITDCQEDNDLFVVADTVDSLGDIIGDTVIYKDNQFKYFHPSDTTIDELSTQVVENARYMVENFGIGLFEKHPLWLRHRYTHLKAPLPGGFYLSLKGGSGSGTFAVDMAVGIDRGQRTRIGGELWRTGLDTSVDMQTGKRIARIIRTGSAASKRDSDWEEKSQAFENFKRIFNMPPSRATTFLLMLMAHDLPDVTAIRALTLEGVRDRTMTHAKGSSNVRFDYTKHFTECGFSTTADPYWLEVGNDPDGFYQALQTTPERHGLRRNEAQGLDRLVDGFRNLRCVRNSLLPPISICGDTSQEELRAAVPALMSLRP